MADAVTDGALIQRTFSWLVILPSSGIAYFFWNRTLPDEEAVEAPD